MQPEISADTIDALRTLRKYARHSMVAGPVCDAIELLDRQGHFRLIDGAPARRRPPSASMSRAIARHAT